MSDFLTADIDELLNGTEPEEPKEDKAYRDMLASDNKLVNTFRKKETRLQWPEPVRKRHIR